MGAYHAALFHLATHAFFKCLLFLGAGAVIHEMQHLKEQHQLDIDPQDIRNMGGLGRRMPLTFVAITVASLALAGFPLTAGFLSKDALLVHALEWGAIQQGWTRVLPYLLFIASGFTAFYIGRLLFKVFVAPATAIQPSHAHEAGRWMLVPMVFLAACSLFPLFSIHPLDIGHVWLTQQMRPQTLLPAIPAAHLLVPAGATILTVLMTVLTWQWYVKGSYPLHKRGLLYNLSLNQGYIDRFYHIILVTPILRLSRILRGFDRYVVDAVIDGFGRMGRMLAAFAAWLDQYIVDGLVRSVGKAAYGLGNVLRRSQTGRVQYYLFTMFFVVLMILLYQMIIQA